MNFYKTIFLGLVASVAFTSVQAQNEATTLQQLLDLVAEGSARDNAAETQRIAAFEAA